MNAIDDTEADECPLGATVSSGDKSAGIWINYCLFLQLRKMGAKLTDDGDLESLVVRISSIDERGIIIDTFDGNMEIKTSLQDVDHIERYARGRMNKDWSVQLASHHGYFSPQIVDVKVIDLTKIQIELPNNCRPHHRPED